MAKNRGINTNNLQNQQNQQIFSLTKNDEEKNENEEEEEINDKTQEEKAEEEMKNKNNKNKKRKVNLIPKAQQKTKKLKKITTNTNKKRKTKQNTKTKTTIPLMKNLKKKKVVEENLELSLGEAEGKSPLPKKVKQQKQQQKKPRKPKAKKGKKIEIVDSLEMKQEEIENAEKKIDDKSEETLEDVMKDLTSLIKKEEIKDEKQQERILAEEEDRKRKLNTSKKKKLKKEEIPEEQLEIDFPPAKKIKMEEKSDNTIIGEEIQDKTSQGPVELQKLKKLQNFEVFYDNLENVVAILNLEVKRSVIMKTVKVPSRRKSVGDVMTTLLGDLKNLDLQNFNAKMCKMETVEECDVQNVNQTPQNADNAKQDDEKPDVKIETRSSRAQKLRRSFRANAASDRILRNGKQRKSEPIFDGLEVLTDTKKRRKQNQIESVATTPSEKLPESATGETVAENTNFEETEPGNKIQSLKEELLGIMKTAFNVDSKRGEQNVNPAEIAETKPVEKAEQDFAKPLQELTSSKSSEGDIEDFEETEEHENPPILEKNDNNAEENFQNAQNEDSQEPPKLFLYKEDETNQQIQENDEGKNKIIIITTAGNNNNNNNNNEETVEDKSDKDKDNILQALGLQRLRSVKQKSNASQQKEKLGVTSAGNKKSGGVNGNEIYTTGTLKTVIKLHREKKRRRIKLSASQHKDGVDGQQKQNGGQTGGGTTDGAHHNRKHANRSNQLDASSDPSDSDTPQDGAIKALVIPEKASSFSIHPGRLCKDECSYCFGKFGLFDTPCHVAQMKSVERQDRILAAEKHLTRDSCLCDACYRHVDRKANTPNSANALTSSTKKLNQPRDLCHVIDCREPAEHFLRRKWLAKIKRNVGRVLNIDLDSSNTGATGSALIGLCATHHSTFEPLTRCAMCKRRLAKNHSAHFLEDSEICENVPKTADPATNETSASTTCKLNDQVTVEIQNNGQLLTEENKAKCSDKNEFTGLKLALVKEGVPIDWRGGRALVCKLCRCFASIALMNREQRGVNDSAFFDEYKKRLLHFNNIVRMDASIAERPIVLPPKKSSQIPQKSHQKKKMSAKSSSESSESESNARRDENFENFEENREMGDVIDYNTLIPDINMEYDESDKDEQKKKRKRNVANLKKFPIQQVDPMVSMVDGSDILAVKKLGSNPSISVRQLFPGEEDLPLDFRVQFDEVRDRTPEGWEKCVSIVQYDAETKRLWQNLQKPYGNQSSFLRHLILLEKYFRNGDLVLSPKASHHSINYSESVHNRLRAYDNISSNQSSTSSRLTSIQNTFPSVQNAANRISINQNASNSFATSLNLIPTNQNQMKEIGGGVVNLNLNNLSNDGASPEKTGNFVTLTNATPLEPDLIRLLPSTVTITSTPNLNIKNFQSFPSNFQNLKNFGNSLDLNVKSPTSSQVPGLISLRPKNVTNVAKSAPKVTQQTQKIKFPITKNWRPNLIPIDPNKRQERKPGLVQVISGGKPYHITLEDYKKMCAIKRSFENKQKQHQQQVQAKTSQQNGAGQKQASDQKNNQNGGQRSYLITHNSNSVLKKGLIISKKKPQQQSKMTPASTSDGGEQEEQDGEVETILEKLDRQVEKLEAKLKEKFVRLPKIPKSLTVIPQTVSRPLRPTSPQVQITKKLTAKKQDSGPSGG